MWDDHSKHWVFADGFFKGLLVGIMLGVMMTPVLFHITWGCP